MRLEQIHRLTVDSNDDREEPKQTLELRRCWPVNANHLLLEYSNEAGMIVPGQWRRDPGELEQLAAEMGDKLGLQPIRVSSTHSQMVLLQPQGLDHQLRGLTALLRSQNSQLLSHRPGKRAIVRWLGENPPHYCKLFASGRAFRRAVQNFEHAHHAAEGLAEGFRTPAIQRSLKHSQTLILTAVVGTSLHEQLRQCTLDLNDARRIGWALRTLQAMPSAPHLREHGPDDEARILTTWMQHLATYMPEWAERMMPHCDTITAHLRGCESQMVLAHRDLHDKQILISPDQQPGFIDFDTLAMADPALDPANLLAHLELRQIQGICSQDVRLATAHAVLQGYGSSHPPKPFQTYLDAARLRLACVYGFRPRWQCVMDPLLARIGESWDTGMGENSGR